MIKMKPKSQNSLNLPLTAKGLCLNVFLINPRVSFGEAVLGLLFGGGPCLFWEGN